MRNAQAGQLILLLALFGIHQAAAQDGPYDEPYEYYDTEEEPRTYEDYGEWLDEERFNLDYEMNVPGYEYEGDMVFEKSDDTENGEGRLDLDGEYRGTGRPPEPAEEAWPEPGGDAGGGYDYYTDDWYEYRDSFTEWYDSL